MGKRRTILMVVEGEKAEKKLIERALDVYGITAEDDEVEIYAYCANIYDLY